MKMKAKILIDCMIVLSLALLLNINSYAAYLKNVPTVVKNPDGTEIRCFATGDEYFNYLHDANGYTTVFPIPIDVLNLNKNLTQNPGY